MKKRKRRVTKRAALALKIGKIKRKYADHPYLDNMIKRAIYDKQYKDLNLRFRCQIVCFYCGMPASGHDHQPPLSRAESYITACKMRGVTPKLLKLSCCGECNRLLSNTVFPSFEKSLEILRMRLSRKYIVEKDDKLLAGRLKRRLSFNRGLDRMRKMK